MLNDKQDIKIMMRISVIMHDYLLGFIGSVEGTMFEYNNYLQTFQQSLKSVAFCQMFFLRFYLYNASDFIATQIGLHRSKKSLDVIKYYKGYIRMLT